MHCFPLCNACLPGHPALEPGSYGLNLYKLSKINLSFNFGCKVLSQQQERVTKIGQQYYIVFNITN